MAGIVLLGGYSICADAQNEAPSDPDNVLELGGPDGVAAELARVYLELKAIFKTGVMDPWFSWKKRILEEHGFAFGFSGYWLYQGASDPPGADLESAVTFFLEFLRGFESFVFEQTCVTVFGSARFQEDHRYYQLARETGKLDRFPIIGMGGDFWDELRGFGTGTMLSEGTISLGDLELLQRAGSTDEAVRLIQNS